MTKVYRLIDSEFYLEIRNKHDLALIRFEREDLSFCLRVSDRKIRINVSNSDEFNCMKMIEFKTIDNIEIGIDSDDQIIVTINSRNLAQIHPICNVADLVSDSSYNAEIGLYGLQTDSMRDLLNADCFNFEIGDHSFDVDIEI